MLAALMMIALLCAVLCALLLSAARDVGWDPLVAVARCHADSGIDEPSPPLPIWRVTYSLHRPRSEIDEPERLAAA